MLAIGLAVFLVQTSPETQSRWTSERGVASAATHQERWVRKPFTPASSARASAKRAETSSSPASVWTRR